MIDFREKCEYDDCDHDICGNNTIAILEINSTKIPLCTECVKDLKDGIDDFYSRTFCFQCKEFIISPHGWHYGGSCKLKARKDGKEIRPDDAGYLYTTNCMDTCREAKRGNNDDK